MNTQVVLAKISHRRYDKGKFLFIVLTHEVENGKLKIMVFFFENDLK